jgi:hypothetical protein
MILTKHIGIVRQHRQTRNDGQGGFAAA